MITKKGLNELFWFLSLITWCMGFVAFPMEFTYILRHGYEITFIPLSLICIPLTIVFGLLYYKFKDRRCRNGI